MLQVWPAAISVCPELYQGNSSDMCAETAGNFSLRGIGKSKWLAKTFKRGILFFSNDQENTCSFNLLYDEFGTLDAGIWDIIQTICRSPRNHTMATSPWSDSFSDHSSKKHRFSSEIVFTILVHSPVPHAGIYIAGILSACNFPR